MSPAERAAFEERLAREVHRFDLKPLLDLLAARGYDRGAILFESTHEGASSSSAIVRAIRFPRKPARGVVITLNLGLLGDNTLLPSYFFRVIEASPDPDRFFDFIRFFDHRLIDNLLRAIYPEDDPRLYSDWAGVQRSFFKMLGPASVSTMQWIGQRHFPELGVRVSRRALASETTSHAFRTGESRLDGTGILGKVYQSDATGFLLELTAEEETDARGRGWPSIVRERLNERVLPLLAPFRVPLVVRLRVLFHASWARLDAPAAVEHGYLGYERLRGDAESGHATIVYRGVTGVALRA